MNKTKNLLLCLVIGMLAPFINRADEIKKLNIGLLIVATGKYTCFIPPLIASAEQYFMTNHNRTYFVFTNNIDQIPKQENIVTIYQEQLPWPFITMMRCDMYCKAQSLLESMDYLFASDADMRFVNTVGDEILSDLVATRHPGFGNPQRKFTYERNPLSTAYIPDPDGDYYYAGGFYGGRTDLFLAMNETMRSNIYKDLEQKIVAVWHDESHLNHYFWYHKPTLVLSPSYCYAQGSGIPFTPRLVALCKNHAEIRTN